MFLRFRLPLLLCLAASSAAWGQAVPQVPAQVPCNLHIHGQVRSGEDLLGGATIVLAGTGRGALADADGHFHLDGLCPGDYQLQIRYVGMQPQTVRIRVARDAELNFTLLPDSSASTVVTIRGVRPTAPEARAGLAGEALFNTRGGNLGQALATLPGVSVLQTGPTIAKPVIHGMTGNRVLILNNGVRHEGQQWGAEHAPEIDPFIANRLTVVKGAPSIRYGADAVGGVVLVEPDPLPDTLGQLDGLVQLVGSSNGLLAGGSAQVQGRLARAVPGLGFRLQGSTRLAGDLRAPDFWLNNTGLRERSFSAALGYRWRDWNVQTFYSQFESELGILAWAHAGSLGDLQRRIAFGGALPEERHGFSRTIGRPRQDVEHQLWKTEARWNVPAGHLQLVYAFQRNYRAEYDQHKIITGGGNLQPDDQPALTFEIRTHTLDAVWEFGSKQHWRSTLGLQGISQDNDFGGPRLIPFFQSYGGGAFWVQRWVGAHWTYEGAVRYDDRWLGNLREANRPIDRTYRFRGLSGNLGAAYTAASGWRAKLNLGSNWRAPNINELYSDGVHHGTASYETGDPNLAPERAYSAVLSLATPVSGQLQVEVAPFYKYIDGFIVLVPGGALRRTIRGFFPSFRYSAYDTRYYGLDVTASYAPHPRWRAQASGSLVRARDLDNQRWIPFTPADRAQLSLRYVLPPMGRWRNSYVQAGVRAVAKQTRYVPPQPAATSPEQAVGTDYAPPPPGYLLLDVLAGTEWHWGRQPVRLSLSVENALNTEYRDYLDRLRYFAPAPGIAAVLRVEIPFSIHQPS